MLLKGKKSLISYLSVSLCLGLFSMQPVHAWNQMVHLVTA